MRVAFAAEEREKEKRKAICVFRRKKKKKPNAGVILGEFHGTVDKFRKSNNKFMKRFVRLTKKIRNLTNECS